MQERQQNVLGFNPQLKEAILKKYRPSETELKFEQDLSSRLSELQEKQQHRKRIRIRMRDPLSLDEQGIKTEIIKHVWRHRKRAIKYETEALRRENELYATLQTSI